MQHIKLTTNELAHRMRVDYAIASNFLKLLASRNLAKKAGEQRKNEKGKPSTVWEIPDEVTIKIDVEQC